MTSADIQARRGWPRRKVALLGVGLIVPFICVEALIKILSASSSDSTPVYALIVLSFFFVFVSGAGLIVLLVTWFTPRGKRPFFDPVRLW